MVKRAIKLSDRKECWGYGNGEIEGMNPRSGKPSRDEYFVISLARGLAVLAAFTPERPELTLSEIAEVAGVTNPSALRIA
jgi:hypothetical protein